MPLFDLSQTFKEYKENPTFTVEKFSQISNQIQKHCFLLSLLETSKEIKNQLDFLPTHTKCFLSIPDPTEHSFPIHFHISPTPKQPKEINAVDAIREYLNSNYSSFDVYNLSSEIDFIKTDDIAEKIFLFFEGTLDNYILYQKTILEHSLPIQSSTQHKNKI